METYYFAIQVKKNIIWERVAHMRFKRMGHWILCAKCLTVDGAGRKEEKWLGLPHVRLCEEDI